jgi:hypothetical protein
VDGFLFRKRRASVVVVPEVIPTQVLTQEAAARAPAVEAEHRYEGEPAKEELNLATDRGLRGIYEPGQRRILVALVELVEVFAAPVNSASRSNRFYLLCLVLSTATEKGPRPQSAARNLDYRS